MRIEKIVTIVHDRSPSDKYLNYGWSFGFKDKDGNKYEWHTVTLPNNYIKAGQKWLVRMTEDFNFDVLGTKYTRVSRVNFIEEIK